MLNLLFSILLLASAALPAPVFGASTASSADCTFEPGVATLLNIGYDGQKELKITYDSNNHTGRRYDSHAMLLLADEWSAAGSRTTFFDFAEFLAAKKPKPTWPSTAQQMDDFLKVPGKRIPDTPGTPGRGKVEWRPNPDTKITFEQHPYHPNAPDWHKGPHFHLDTPGIKPHQRYVPGDPIPGYP